MKFALAVAFLASNFSLLISLKSPLNKLSSRFTSSSSNILFSTANIINHKITPDPKYNAITVESGKVSLCRCWLSDKFPYCNGAHVSHNKQTGDTVTSIVVSVPVSTTATPTVPLKSPNLESGDVKTAIVNDITTLIQFDNKFRGDGTSIAPTLVRLAWHASGTYSKSDQTGGSNGATMRYQPESEWGANNGLALARGFLEPIKRKYPSFSYADIWTLSGIAAISFMGGPVIPWKSGRKDSPPPSVTGKALPDGRLPAADKGAPKDTASHIREIFYRMGFNDQEIVALSGAHAVGRCYIQNSGYTGPWTYSETTFSNQYFRLLLDEKWRVKTTHNGAPWTGPLQYETSDGALMMLPSDMVLVEDTIFKTFVEIYAKDEQKFFSDFSNAFSRLLELGVEF